MLNRRAFVTAGVAAPFAAAVTPPETAPATPNILNRQPGMRYRRLGNTDLYVSEISLGGLVMSEAVHQYAIEHGVNLVHVATGYLGGRSIRTLGDVLKTKRDKVYVALKDSFENLDDALKLLNTDYVDFIMFNRHTAEAAKDPKIAETFEAWKKQGKVRFAGMTTHGDVKGSLAAAIQSGMFSIVMPVLNQPAFETVGEELRAAQEKDIGVMAMKTMKGLSGGLPLETAYLKKVLRNPAVTTVTKGIGTYEMFDQYTQALNEPLTSSEDRRLYRFAQANRANNCMMCDECKQVCPGGVEISTVLRSKDYYYGQMNDLPTALAAYHAIEPARRGDENCLDCRRCEGVCPNGMAIVDRLMAARTLFAQVA